MIDHVYVSVADPERSFAFYLAALKPLGWREFGKYDSTSGPATVPDLWGLTNGAGDSGRAISNSIWLRQRQAGQTGGIYLGLQADDTQGVDAAYAAALEAGAEDEGGPGPRAHFAEGYYAANVADFVGYRLDFVHKSWDPKRPG